MDSKCMAATRGYPDPKRILALRIAHFSVLVLWQAVLGRNAIELAYRCSIDHRHSNRHDPRAGVDYGHHADPLGPEVPQVETYKFHRVDYGCVARR